MADPTGFEPAISSVTGWHVGPLHHGPAGVTGPEHSRPVRGLQVADPDRRSAIRRAVAEARRGDVVLIAGKGHEPYQEIAGVRRPFADVVEAGLALEAWRP